MKKEFLEPEIEYVKFDDEDIITTSPPEFDTGKDESEDNGGWDQ